MGDITSTPDARTKAQTAQALARMKYTPSPSQTRLDRVISILLVLTSLGVIWAGGQRIVQGYSLYAQDRMHVNTLHAIRARQLHYDKESSAFAGSIDALKLLLPPEQSASLRVVAGTIGGKRTFLAEVCSPGRCSLVNASGQLQEAVTVKPAGIQGLAPAPMPGDGRLLQSVRKSRLGGSNDTTTMPNPPQKGLP